MEGKLRQLMKHEGINSTRLAEILGIQASGISHIMSGRNKPSFDFLLKLLQRFPQINPDWLLLDKGHMYRDEIKNKGGAGKVGSAASPHNSGTVDSGMHSMGGATGGTGAMGIGATGMTGMTGTTGATGATGAGVQNSVDAGWSGSAGGSGGMAERGLFGPDNDDIIPSGSHADGHSVTPSGTHSAGHVGHSGLHSVGHQNIDWYTGERHESGVYQAGVGSAGHSGEGAQSAQWTQQGAIRNTHQGTRDSGPGRQADVGPDSSAPHHPVYQTSGFTRSASIERIVVFYKDKTFSEYQPE